MLDSAMDDLKQRLPTYESGGFYGLLMGAPTAMFETSKATAGRDFYEVCRPATGLQQAPLL